MGNSKSSTGPLEDFEWIHTSISTKLEEKKTQFSERFFNCIYLLEPVDGSNNNEFLKRLQETQKIQTCEGVVLIPYYVPHSHWAGIVLTFDVDKELKEADFIDPIMNSDMNLTEMQNEFSQLFPKVILQSKIIQKLDDPAQSAERTIENLVNAVEEIYSNLAKSSTDPDNADVTPGVPDKDDDSSEPKQCIDKTQQRSSSSNEDEEIIRRKTSLLSTDREQQDYQKDGIHAPVDNNPETSDSDRSEDECLFTNEDLSIMYHDFNALPSCSERHIIALLFYISAKLLNNETISGCNINASKDIEKKVMTELDLLRKRLEIEELQSGKIQDIVKTCNADLKGKNWKNVLVKLKKLLKEVSPLDVQELARIVEKAGGASKLIEGKEIILLLGGTGTGKSTLTHFFGGSTMVEVTMKGLPHIKPSNIRNPDLEKITTSPFAKSETRHISPVTVNFEDIGGSNGDSIILCDSPGFEDSRGAEVDIANGVGIVKAIRGCKSVKPTILISGKSIGDRCDGIKNMAHMLVGLIPGIQDHMKTFSYIFTKFTYRERSSIHALLKDIYDKLNEEEKADTSFANLLKDMVQKTRKSSLVIDPIRDNPLDILEELTRTHAISNPDEVFHFSITQKSKSIIREHVLKHQVTIVSATKRSDYLFIQYKLDQLKYLKDLLQYDYIEQIYHTSVDYIAKHLSEEYHMGTSDLKRCLMNQTTLSSTDIEKYKICIKHSQDAEQLRDEHLRNDVLHTDAFIQYLKNLVAEMHCELKKKDIDDLLVKITLDKTKLLSTFFPEVADFYTNICQFFTENIDAIVESFKDSVQHNKFDVSASNMTKLHDVFANLGDHFACEPIEQKYNQLREYFLEHLNDSTRHFDDIFTEQLDKSDIDKLNRCVCMLENAINTVSLHSHISKKELNRIYDRLSLKISDHFKAVAERINEEIKKKIELSGLEQLLAQLDLLRTISNSPSEMHQLYYSALETLIGYIKESRRDAEKMLTALFHQEKVDFDTLVSCLVSLKSAKWIEKYRTGVYSDVIGNVEKQIIEEVIAMIENLKQTNLDLYSFNKIKDAYKIVSQINGMQRLDKFIASISGYIDEANKWFTKEINDVFDMTKTIFDKEKLKKQYPTLDFNKAENALNYLHICKEIPARFAGASQSTLNSLEEFIQCFSRSVEAEMANNFEVIKRYQGNEKDSIFEKAHTLLNRLQEISEVETNYRRVFCYFSNKNVIEQWENNLSSYLNELSDEMELLRYTGRGIALQSKLSIAKALSKLDIFMKHKKFIDIYKEYQNVFFLNTTDTHRKAMEAIKNNEYHNVASELATLQSLDKVGEYFLQQAKQAINFGLSTLFEETKTRTVMLGNNVEIKEISPIVENLKRMTQARQFLSEFLDKSTKIAVWITEVKELIAERMKYFIKGVQALITVNNFYEADKKIETIAIVRTLLGPYCREDISKEINKLRENQKDVVLTQVVKKYSEMDISKYTLHPPSDIFAKFGEVNNTNPVYHEAYNKIKEAILAKLRHELSEAKLKLSPTVDNIHIRKFQSAVKYLPKDMAEALEIELKYCKEDIEQAIHQRYKKLNDACNSRDLTAIKNIIEEYKNLNDAQEYVNEVRGFIMKSAQDIVVKIKKCFEEEDVAEAFLNVKVLHNYQLNFQNLLTDITQPCLDVKGQIADFFQKAYRYFIDEFLDGRTTITDDVIQTVEKVFSHLIEFFRFNDENKSNQILVDMFPKDFNEKNTTLETRLVQYFDAYEKKYKEALKILDATTLKSVLDLSKQWNLLFIKIKNCFRSYLSNDDTTSTVAIAVIEFTLFPQILESTRDKIEELKESLIKQELINTETKEFKKQRDEFYKKLNEQYIILDKLKILSTFNINVDVKKAEEECLKSLEAKIVVICSATETIVDQYTKDVRLRGQDYVKFNLYYNNMVSFKQEMNVAKFSSLDKIDSIEKLVLDKIRIWQTKIEDDTSVDNVAKLLIHMKNAEINFEAFKSKIHDEIDSALSDYKSSKKDKRSFGKLCVLLNQDPKGIGQTIVSEHKVFQGYSLSLFNEKVQRHDIKYVLDKVYGERLDISKLKKRYDEYHGIYADLIKEYLKPNIALDQLIAAIQLLAGDVKQHSDQIEWDATIRNKIPKLAAHVFALWTLQNANHYFDAEDAENRNSYIMQPHAAQVIAVFRILGIGDSKEELSNNLVQISTGEGKSVTLGATAAILALLGFDVCCACYSEYLSQRDYIAFSSLFDSLGVLSHIHYGTFNKLCEYIINENGDIRQVVEQLILKDSNIAVENAKKFKRSKILLIDEVDVFFSRDFYGNIYAPATNLKDPMITSLVNFIWAERKSHLTLNKIIATQEYKNCCARFPKWESIIQEAIRDMFSDVNSFQSHSYTVKDDKIGYIEQDKIIYNVTYGYKTLFAYYFEHENGKISKRSLNDNVCIRVKCGSFSYAEIPVQFQKIMGVTGTLVTLSDSEKKVLTDVYHVKKNTIIPSVFGENQLKFIKKEDIKIENNDDYFNVIQKEISDRLTGRSDKRAVLVFFETEKRLKEFYLSKALEPIKSSVVHLTEEASSEEKEIIVKRATGSGQVTLFTRIFGRGTDFICYDPAVARNDGVHVIQTFLSEEVSEEIQIKGRTARQGDNGSYSMILLDRDLEKFHIGKSDVQDVMDGKAIPLRLLHTVTNAITLTKKYDSVYDLLDDKRKNFFATRYEDNKKYVEHAQERHKIGEKFLSSLKSGNLALITNFLIEENKGVQGTAKSRTICLMDATCSMSHLLQKSKNTVGVMFERASEILREHKISSTSFEIQFVVYRNYCCQENKILQHSPWETKPDALRAFMNTIDVEGGLGNEAIEIGLWHANEENERASITQVILIGDAPPNTKTEVHDKRKLWGENYWRKTQFAKATYYEDELAKLISNRIPVHAYYVDIRAKQSFQHIADQTKGRCKMLNINSIEGSGMLTDLVTEEILGSIDRDRKGNALVEAYRQKFGRAYT